MRNAGTPIGTSVVMAAAQGIVNAYDRTLLYWKWRPHQNFKELGSSFTGTTRLCKTQSYNEEYNYSRMSDKQFQRVKTMLLKQVSRVSKLSNIPESLIINIDQTKFQQEIGPRQQVATCVQFFGRFSSLI